MLPPDFKTFFHPKSIAIIGASTKPFKFGNLFLKAILDFQYPGKIFPVNPRGEKIYGLDSWMLEDIPEPIDLVYITVPAKQVPEEIQKCAGRTKSVIILTAGFKETGEEGKKIEEKCAEIARKNGIRVIGPNCFGIYYAKGGITLLPGGNFPKESGNIAMLSQSGGHSVNFVLLGQSSDLKFSKVISYGNALDLDFPDFLEYLNEDPETNIVAAYIEGVRNIRKLKKVIKDFNKPLIIWKCGLRGELLHDTARAAASHTGFLAGNSEIWKGFFQQNNILLVDSFEELLDTTKALAYLPALDNTIDYRNRIGVIGGGGGIGIAITDVSNRFGLRIPKLSEEVKENLKEYIPIEGTSINNPLDTGNPMFRWGSGYKKILNIFMGDPNISVLINDLIVDYVLDLRAIHRVLRDYKEEFNIPIVIILRKLLNTLNNVALERKYRKIRDKFHASQIPVFPSFNRGVCALANYLNYYKNIK